ncbi:unnamed protein product [Bemisia tabaci]|uniref:Uncharacterized protein n=1 Tax=Bemisia tabaci TaxID=7038 RepID=A0A9P0EVS7_BEMTA|nr:unnamed protein product [Bemisia tabaci]
MEKKFVLADALDNPSKKKTVINWELCILCQENSDESLVCPARKTGEGYKLLASDLEAFQKAQVLPCSIDIEGLSGESSLVENFTKNQAKFHKQCRAKFTQYKLQRHLNSVARAKYKSEASSTAHFTRSLDETKNDKNNCLFCEKEDGTLHAIETKELSDKIKLFAEILQDQKILAKISEGDAIAIEAKYHLECLARFYNRKRSADRQENRHDSEDDSFAIAFAELTSYVQDLILEQESTTIPVFNLKKLVTLLENRLEQLTGLRKFVHSTRVKNMLLKVIPGLTAFNQGRDVLITTNKDVGEALRKACKFDSESDLINVGKLIRKIRLQSFEAQSVKVCSLDDESQANCVPPLLLALVKMLLYGPNCQQQAENHSRQEALTLAQLISFNMKKTDPTKSNALRHKSSAETPFPVYLSLMLHCKTRKRDLIDIVHRFGIGISYDRVLQISSALSHQAIEYFQEKGVVCSPYLQRGVFVTSAVDNIDINPSSTTAKSCFHGTAISLQQHYEHNQPKIEQKVTIKDRPVSKKIPFLPKKYTSVSPLFLKKEDTKFTQESDHLFSVSSIKEGKSFETTNNWLNKVETELLISSNPPKNVSWGSFNSTFLLENNTSVTHMTTCELLPMFSEVAHTPAMIAHAMKIASESTEYLNKGQIPIMTCDEPLFAIAKQLQWQFPDKFGEDKFVVMLGGLHIEKAILNVLGDLLDGSGWVETLVEAGITSSGRAQSFIQVHHIKRTRHAHQVTLCALFVLKKQAYSNYVVDFKENIENETDELLSFKEWDNKYSESSPQFLFWSLVIELEECLLEFLTSLRSSNFELYIKSLTKISSWFFTFNHYNYARWLPVHLRDMVNLKGLHPSIHAEFLNGKFTANISGRKFSAMALDQAHEQCNSRVKGDGGAVGLTENSDELRRWMVAGPEISRVIQEFEKGFRQLSKSTDKDKDHHESSAAFQSLFFKHVQALIQTIDDAGNPFEGPNQELQNLQNKLIISGTGVAELEALRDYGSNAFEDFVRDRLIEGTDSVFSPLKKHDVNLFRPKSKVKNKSQLSMKSIKSDASLFSRLYIVCQQRGSDLDDFFSHENQPYPPSLSDFGQIRKGTKSDIRQCLKNECDFEFPKEIPSASCVILDGPAIVHLHVPKDSRTFHDYVENFSDKIVNEWPDAITVLISYGMIIEIVA